MDGGWPTLCHEKEAIACICTQAGVIAEVFKVNRVTYSRDEAIRSLDDENENENELYGAGDTRQRPHALLSPRYFTLYLRMYSSRTDPMSDTASAAAGCSTKHQAP